MINSIILQKMPYPVLRRLFYAWYDYIRKPKCENAIKESELTRLNLSDLVEVKSSDTLFILGSGSSINEISEERWNQINSANSIGFNFWVAHPFVPDFYTTELHDFDVNPLGRVVTNRLVSLLGTREDYQQIPVFLSDYDNSRERCLDLYPSWIRRHAFSVASIPAIARNRSELFSCLRYLEDRQTFCNNSLKMLFKYKATVSSLVALGSMMGYEHIVLCGVDLVDSDYFYQDLTRYPEMEGFRSSKPGTKHATARRTRMMMPIDEVLYAMEEIILRPRGIELWVENDSSGLHPRLNVFPESHPHE